MRALTVASVRISDRGPANIKCSSSDPPQVPFEGPLFSLRFVANETECIRMKPELHRRPMKGDVACEAQQDAIGHGQSG